MSCYGGIRGYTPNGKTGAEKANPSPLKQEEQISTSRVGEGSLPVGGCHLKGPLIKPRRRYKRGITGALTEIKGLNGKNTNTTPTPGSVRTI
jgi:hypothetical protein